MKKLKSIIVMLVAVVLLPLVANSTPWNQSENISQTYFHIGGILVSVVNENNQTTIFERGMVRMIVNEAGKVISISIWGTDNITDEASLKAFLKSKGVDEEQLKVKDWKKGVDEDENVIQGWVGWLQKAVDWLKGGINYSISIDLDPSQGATVTFFENNKPMMTYGTDTDGEELLRGLWTYNEDGSLETFWELEFEPLTQEKFDELFPDEEDGKAAGFVEEGNIWVKRVATETTYVDGRAMEVWELDADGKRTEKKVQGYTYAANGSMLTMVDYKKEETTYFSGGKSQYTVTNADIKMMDKDGETTGEVIEAGSVVRRWIYHPNGALDTVVSMNVRGEWTTTAFINGRAVITVEGDDVSGDDARLTYDAILAGTYAFDANPDGVISINIYNDQLAGLSPDDLRILIGNVTQLTGGDLNEIIAAVNGTSGNGNSLAFSVTYGYAETWADDGDGTTYLSMLTVTIAHKGAALFSFEYTLNDPTLPVLDLLAEVINLSVAEDLIDYKITEDNWQKAIDDLKEVLEAKKDSIDSESVKELKVIVEELDALFVADVDWRSTGDSLEQARENTRIAIDTLIGRINTVKRIIVAGEVATKAGLKELKAGMTVAVDPTIVGTVLEVLEMGGVWYVVVAADEIDMYDGSGLVTIADGETFYVAVDEETANDMRENNIGAKILFTGDIAEDVDGYLTITMVDYGKDEESYGGYVIGEEAIKAFENSRENKTWYNDLVATMIIKWDEVEQEYGEHSDWKQGFEFLRAYTFG